jgi:hypothetical protein
LFSSHRFLRQSNAIIRAMHWARLNPIIRYSGRQVLPQVIGQGSILPFSLAMSFTA